MIAHTIAARRAQVAAYDFRGVHPALRLGTASDRYAAWIGQIYSEKWQGAIKTRRKQLGGKTYEERVLPVECVEEYFDHFDVLELDFTFYRPLLDAEGEATPNLFTLGAYAEHLPDHARVFLKAPQLFTAPTIRLAAREHAPNPSYLDADGYRRAFLEPAHDVLKGRLGGVIIEQGYRPVRDVSRAESFVAEVETFFERLRGERVQMHLEIRSPQILTTPYFDWLESVGLGHVFSHWTFLPMLREQWTRSGGRLTAADGTVVCRLLTPLGVRYEDAWARTYPFDRPVDEIASSEEAMAMIDDVAALLYRTHEQGKKLNVFANNRAFGNAPALAQAVTHRVLDHEERLAGRHAHDRHDGRSHPWRG